MKDVKKDEDYCDNKTDTGSTDNGDYVLTEIEARVAAYNARLRSWG